MEDEKDIAYGKDDGIKTEKRLNLNHLLRRLKIEEKKRKKLNLITISIIIILSIVAYIYLI